MPYENHAEAVASPRRSDRRGGACGQTAARGRTATQYQYHLIIRGNVLIHLLHGHVMSEVIDDDVKERRFDGLLGVQVHVGPPMKIEDRNFRLKKLPPVQVETK